jgi:hypothetical protein
MIFDVEGDQWTTTPSSQIQVCTTQWGSYRSAELQENPAADPTSMEQQFITANPGCEGAAS